MSLVQPSRAVSEPLLTETLLLPRVSGKVREQHFKNTSQTQGALK